MDKLERKFGKYAIPNLTLALIIGYALGYIIQYVDKFRGTDFLSFLYLDPVKIVEGQVWRVFTWLIVPPYESNFFFILLMMWCCLSIGMVLEKTWGTFRFNVYIFGGVLFTVISAFLSMGFLYISLSLQTDGWEALKYIDEALTPAMWGAFSTYYINMSIYLGFAMTYPNNMVRFMFFIPMKMKWLGIIDLVYMGYMFVMGGTLTRFAVAAAVINILIFYLVNIRRFSIKAKIRRAQYEKKARTPKMQAGVTYKHKCSICGQTDESNPDLEFRYCSKCNGNYEYCQEHLFTHTHKK
ncbi:MAG: hypothetical protein IJ691_06875 [Lachnospiraceae bacterium]|nr:hypothetical protein [Lachnospiraceae bacterium]